MNEFLLFKLFSAHNAYFSSAISAKYSPFLASRWCTMAALTTPRSPPSPTRAFFFRNFRFRLKKRFCLSSSLTWRTVLCASLSLASPGRVSMLLAGAGHGAATASARLLPGRRTLRSCGRPPRTLDQWRAHIARGRGYRPISTGTRFLFKAKNKFSDTHAFMQI